MMNSIGSVFAALFGVFWTIMAASSGAPGFFVMFGFIFIGIAVVQGIYHYKNATSKNRYSVYDITTSEEESDPFNDRFRVDESKYEVSDNNEVSDGETCYCPYCGTKVEGNYLYCRQCGKKLP